MDKFFSLDFLWALVSMAWSSPSQSLRAGRQLAALSIEGGRRSCFNYNNCEEQQPYPTLPLPLRPPIADTFSVFHIHITRSHEEYQVWSARSLKTQTSDSHSGWGSGVIRAIIILQFCKYFTRNQARTSENLNFQMSVKTKLKQLPYHSTGHIREES